MEQELPAIESLYDFFYLDSRKISSFYSQLTGEGALELYTKTHSNEDGQKLQGSIALPTVISGSVESNQNANTSGQKQYNAIHTMPREMIDKLDEQGFINRELTEDNFGKLVLLKGRLGVIDVNMLGSIVDPALNFYIKEMRSSNKKNERDQAKEISSMKKDIITFLQNIPFAIQSRFIVGEGESAKEVWMTLNRDEVSTSAHDANFKHGEFTAGEWYLLGVLDALPNDDYSFTGASESDIQSMMREFVNQLKTLGGRSQSSYGVTPIAIFRNIKSNK